MKILSPFRDYYDSAMAYGQDPTRVYERVSRTRIVPEHVWPYSGGLLARLREMPRGGSLTTVHRSALLLVCGQIWPVFYRHLHEPYRLVTPFADDLPRRIATARLYPLWREEYEIMRDSGERSERDEAESFFFAPKSEGGWRANFNPHTARTIENTRMKALHESFPARPLGADLLIGEVAPVALLISSETWSEYHNEIAIVTNPRLADLGFQRIMDPFTCFQTIETFLGNQLAPADLAPQRVGSDDVIARQKGFDEGSFRTAAPGAKKENRAANRVRKRKG